MTDSFILTDEEGNVIAKKMKVEHIKAILDEGGINPGHKYSVKSEYTDCELVVTEVTTVKEWRDFSEKCELALDDFKAMIHVAD